MKRKGRKVWPKKSVVRVNIAVPRSSETPARLWVRPGSTINKHRQAVEEAPPTGTTVE